MTQWLNRKKWSTGLVLGLVFFSQAILHAWDEETFFQQKRLSAHAFVLPRSPHDWRAQTVIGAPTEYVVQEKDTTLDIARSQGLGYNEMSGAFPSIDPWLPPIGQVLNLPTFWVLPRSGYEGVVVNIPEMRLYYFPPLQQGLSNRSVITLPAGLGREDWPTPQAKFTIRGKTANPVWVIPDSIKKERIQEKGWTEDSIPGGSPDNPLGKYRIELTLPLYAIHDTNNPWAIGRLTTHGCIRLYPEDIAQFFDLIRIGVPGEFVYQPVKLGMLYGKVYAEVHEDIYKLIPDIWTEAQRVVRESGWADMIDQTLLTKALMAKTGVPTDVTKGSQLVEMAGVVPQPNYESDSPPKVLPQPSRTPDLVEKERQNPAPQDRRENEAEGELLPAIGRRNTQERTLEPLPPANETESVVSAINRVERTFLEAEQQIEKPAVERPFVDSPAQLDSEVKARTTPLERPRATSHEHDNTETRRSMEAAVREEEIQRREIAAQQREVSALVREPDRRAEKRVRTDLRSARHLRVRPVKPNVLKFRSYFDSLSDWESGVRNGIQNPHRQEIRNP